MVRRILPEAACFVKPTAERRCFRKKGQAVQRPQHRQVNFCKPEESVACAGAFARDLKRAQSITAD